MHPVIARFLDLSAAVTALEKKEQAASLDADEAAFAAAAEKEPRARAALLKSKGKKSASPETQQQLIVLATRAAAARVADDAALGPKVKAAVAALVAEGATDEEAQALVAQCVLEEAFGYAEDPDHFDAPYLGETLDSLVPLAKLDGDTVDEWLEAFAKEDAAQKALRLSVAETLLEAAWSEGPQPISPEHLDDAIEHVADAVAESEFEKATETLALFIGFLAGKGVVGKERAARLTHILRSAGRSGEREGDFDEEEESGDDSGGDGD